MRFYSALRLGCIIGCAVVITTSATSCGPKARVIGEVKDNFGHPIANVEVSIPSTALKTRTDASGKYNLHCVAGKFSVAFAKDGYLGVSVSQDVAVETTIPLQAVTLYRLPATPGLWFYGDNHYVPLSAGKLIVSGADRRQFQWVYNMSYRVSGDFVKLPQQPQYRFLDNHKSRLALLKVGDNDIVAARAESWSGAGETKGSVIKDSWQQLAEGIGVREASLTPGRYAYVALHSSNYGYGPTRLGEPVFAFEVQ